MSGPIDLISIWQTELRLANKTARVLLQKSVD